MATSTRKRKAPAKSQMSRAPVNTEAKLKPAVSDPEGTQYRCTMCGKFFDKQKAIMTKSTSSPVFEGNNGFTSLCSACTIRYYDYMVEFFNGDEQKALDRLCSMLDLYYSDEIALSSRKSSTETSLIKSYLSRVNMKQYSDKTYLDTIKERASQVVGNYHDIEDIESKKPEGERIVTPQVVERWGLGYTPDEYAQLEAHYKMLRDQIPEDDAYKEVLIKDMCCTKVLQSRAIVNNDMDKYEKLQRSYQTTAKEANLQVKKKDEATSLNSDEACWGCFVRDIEQYTPADLYKQQKLFEDVDGVKGYIERFIVRPFKNFITGSSDMDEEFSVSAGDGDMG